MKTTLLPLALLAAIVAAVVLPHATASAAATAFVALGLVSVLHADYSGRLRPLEDGADVIAFPAESRECSPNRLAA